MMVSVVGICDDATALGQVTHKSPKKLHTCSVRA